MRLSRDLYCLVDRATQAIDEEESARPLCSLFGEVVLDDGDGRAWLNLECHEHGAQWRVVLACVPPASIRSIASVIGPGPYMIEDLVRAIARNESPREG